MKAINTYILTVLVLLFSSCIKKNNKIIEEIISNTESYTTEETEEEPVVVNPQDPIQNTELGILWEKELNIHPLFEFNDSRVISPIQGVPTQDGGIALLFNRPGEFAEHIPDVLQFRAVQAYVVKLNSNGDVEWNLKLDKTEKVSIYSITASSNGGFLLAGNRLSCSTCSMQYNRPSITKSPYLLKINNSGQIVWEKTFTELNVLYNDHLFHAFGFWAYEDNQKIRFLTTRGKIVENNVIYEMILMEMDFQGNIINETSIDLSALKEFYFEEYPGTDDNSQTTKRGRVYAHNEELYIFGENKKIMKIGSNASISIMGEGEFFNKGSEFLIYEDKIIRAIIPSNNPAALTIESRIKDDYESKIWNIDFLDTSMNYARTPALINDGERLLAITRTSYSNSESTTTKLPLVSIIDIKNGELIQQINFELNGNTSSNLYMLFKSTNGYLAIGSKLGHGGNTNTRLWINKIGVTED